MSKQNWLSQVWKADHFNLTSSSQLSGAHNNKSQKKTSHFFVQFFHFSINQSIKISPLLLFILILTRNIGPQLVPDFLSAETFWWRDYRWLKGLSINDTRRTINTTLGFKKDVALSQNIIISEQPCQYTFEPKRSFAWYIRRRRGKERENHGKWNGKST